MPNVKIPGGLFGRVVVAILHGITWGVWGVVFGNLVWGTTCLILGSVFHLVELSNLGV